MVGPGESGIYTGLALVGWDTLPADAHARYPELELDAAMLADADHVLLSSEPYRFRERDIGLSSLRASLA